MITIKGGVEIIPNSDNKEFMEKLREAGVYVKLPFTAKSFKSTKMQNNFNVEIISEEPTKEIKSDIKPKVTQIVKPTPKTTKPKAIKTKKKSILNRLKKTK